MILLMICSIKVKVISMIGEYNGSQQHMRMFKAKRVLIVISKVKHAMTMSIAARDGAALEMNSNRDIMYVD